MPQSNATNCTDRGSGASYVCEKKGVNEMRPSRDQIHICVKNADVVMHREVTMTSITIVRSCVAHFCGCTNSHSYRKSCPILFRRSITILNLVAPLPSSTQRSTLFSLTHRVAPFTSYAFSSSFFPPRCTPGLPPVWRRAW